MTSSIDWLPTAAPNPAFNHVQSTLSVATTVHAHMRARSLQQLLLERHGLRVVFEHVSTIMYALHRGDCVLSLHRFCKLSHNVSMLSCSAIAPCAVAASHGLRQ